MKSCMAILVLWFAVSAIALPVIKGQATSKGASGKPWFVLEKTLEGERSFVVFRDEDGTALSEETVVLSKDHILQSYTWKQHQDGREFKLELKNKKWEMQFNGEEDSIVLPKDPANVVVPPLIAERLVFEWTKNPNLQKFKFSLLVPDRMETFSFVFKRQNEKEGQIQWLLTPESFFVRMVAGEILFLFSKDMSLKEIRDFRPPVKFKTSTGRLEDKKTSVIF